jgi:snRNA-activating protein complex subunit 1
MIYQLAVLVFFFFLIKEGSSILDVQNIKHISEDKELIVDLVEKISDDWQIHKQTFYKQTGLGETDEYEQELEQLLLQQYSDDD